MRRLAWLSAVVLAGCVLKTETVSGPEGKAGKDATDPWVTSSDGGIYYADGPVGIGTENPVSYAAVTASGIRAEPFYLDSTAYISQPAGGNLHYVLDLWIRARRRFRTRFSLPSPRLLHPWPPDRFYARNQGGSPVREIRSPGSVWGA